MAFGYCANPFCKPLKCSDFKPFKGEKQKEPMTDQELINSLMDDIAELKAKQDCKSPTLCNRVAFGACSCCQFNPDAPLYGVDARVLGELVTQTETNLEQDLIESLRSDIHNWKADNFRLHQRIDNQAAIIRELQAEVREYKTRTRS